MKYQFPAEPDSLSRVMQAVEQFAEDAGCSKAQCLNFLLAAEEITTNIIKYAYSGENGDFEMVLDKPDENRIQMIFSDGGRAYNPLEYESPDIAIGLEERALGGLGIHLVRQLALSADYQYEEGKNIFSATFPAK